MEASSSLTGQDLIELHVHGSPSVVQAVLHSLSRLQNLRPAEPGEFTMRAFENGRMDLTQVEGLRDLLNAETEIQRQLAIKQTGVSWFMYIFRLYFDTIVHTEYKPFPFCCRINFLHSTTKLGLILSPHHRLSRQ